MRLLTGFGSYCSDLQTIAVGAQRGEAGRVLRVGVDGLNRRLPRGQAKQLVERKQRFAVLALARQCRQVDDEALAAQLLSVALDGITDKKEKLSLTMATAEFLRGRPVPAGTVLS